MRVSTLLKRKRDKLDALTGMLLGDGFIEKGTSRMGIQHSIKQREYALFKRELLELIFKRDVHTKEYLQARWPNIRLRVTHPYLKRLRQRMYTTEGDKQISRGVLNQLGPIGLALWYLDDGSLVLHKKINGEIDWREGVLCTDCFSLETHQEIVEWLRQRYDIEAKIFLTKGKYYRLRFNATNLTKLFKIIAPYVPPSMFYKIDMQYKFPQRLYAKRPKWTMTQPVLTGDSERLAEMSSPVVNNE